MKASPTKHKRTLKFLLITHVLCLGLFLVFFLVLAGFGLKQMWLAAMGLVLGGLGGLGLICSMSYSIERAVEYDGQAAQKYMLRHYFIRLLLMVSLLLVGVFTGKWLLLGTSLGLICVKISGFLEPGVERYLVGQDKYQKPGRG